MDVICWGTWVSIVRVVTIQNFQTMSKKISSFPSLPLNTSIIKRIHDKSERKKNVVHKKHKEPAM